MYEVEYAGGESRYNPGVSVDFMLVIVDGVELYAEMEPFSDETESYEPLKNEIIVQAIREGINPEVLKFWYDD